MYVLDYRPRITDEPHYIPKKEVDNLIHKLEDEGIIFEGDTMYISWGVSQILHSLIDLISSLRPEFQLIGAATEIDDQGWMYYIYDVKQLKRDPIDLVRKHFLTKT